MFTCKTLIVGLDNINTDAFMWQQFLAEDLRAYGQQLCYLPTLPTEFCAELFQNTTRERMISLQLTCWVTACPLTQSLTLQKTTILYFQRPFLAGWCFLQSEGKKKKKKTREYIKEKYLHLLTFSCKTITLLCNKFLKVISIEKQIFY